MRWLTARGLMAGTTSLAALRKMTHSVNDKDLAFLWDRSSVDSAWAGEGTLEATQRSLGLKQSEGHGKARATRKVSFGG